MRHLIFGTRWEYTAEKRGLVEIYLEPRDLWIGAYIDKSRVAIYVCLLPMLVIRISRGRREVCGS